MAASAPDTPPPDEWLPDPCDRVIVEGPDAESFLQGQISQDVPSLPVGGWAWSFVLAPDGKLDAVVRVHRSAPGRFELVVEVGFGEPLHARLARFKLRTDCVIEAELGAGEELVVPADDGRARIEAGVPRMGVDLESGDLAASTGLVDAAVDFTKGCFVGQELVARMDSRGGSAPTRLVRLRGDGEAPVAAAEVETDAEVVGQVTSVARADSGWVALARVSRKLAADRAEVLGSVAAVEEL